MTSRRLAALVAGLLLLAGCGGDGSSGDGSPAGSPAREPDFAAPRPYRPLAGEPVPDAKQLAADALQAVGTYDEGQGTPEAAVVRLAGRASPGVVDGARALLLPEARSAVDIIYPQLGGLTADAASIMVVLRHRTLVDGEVRSVSRTVDVRLTRSGSGWSVVSVDSTGGAPPEQPAESSLAREVLDNGAIELPDSARWDIEAGRISDRILELLQRVAADHDLRVTVLASGHPYNVFATDSVSNHTVGRAVDVWAVNGEPVVNQQDPDGPLRALAQQLLDEGVTELGGPWDLDGPNSRRSFTNTVHQDHLHLAFDAP